jgi:hypothetical protein
VADGRPYFFFAFFFAFFLAGILFDPSSQVL